MTPELDTERLRLRALRLDDLDAYARMYSNPDVMRFLESGVPLDRAAAFRSMATHLGHWQLRGYGQWALEERATGAFVGRAGLWQPEGWPGLEVGGRWTETLGGTDMPPKPDAPRLITPLMCWAPTR
jgi:RimJ/RimL family protein N-acetyltransferase